MNLNFNAAENELLLTQTAMVRASDNRLGAGVVLNPSGKTLCSCDEDEQAHLIAKLFNNGLKIP